MSTLIPSDWRRSQTFSSETEERSCTRFSMILLPSPASRKAWEGASQAIRGSPKKSNNAWKRTEPMPLTREKATQYRRGSLKTHPQESNSVLSLNSINHRIPQEFLQCQGKRRGDYPQVWEWGKLCSDMVK